MNSMMNSMQWSLFRSISQAAKASFDEYSTLVGSISLPCPSVTFPVLKFEESLFGLILAYDTVRQAHMERLEEELRKIRAVTVRPFFVEPGSEG